MAKKAPQKSTRKYWLFKSEPTSYSFADLKQDKQTYWDGVRNYQARNFLRDDVKVGDRVLFYHSNAKPMSIMGTMKIVSKPYPDHTAFDKNDECHYDPKSDPQNPTWVMVDCAFLQEFKEPVTRDMLKENEITSKMMVMAKGSRLSIQPVTEEEWLAVHKLANVKPKA